MLGELVDRPVEFAPDEELRRQILEGAGGRRLQNVSIKADPAQIQAAREIATIRSVRYRTLIRQRLAEAIRKAVGIGARRARSYSREISIAVSQLGA